MRTVQEITRAALELRARLIKEGKDPLEGVFHVTVEESLHLLMEPWPGNHTLNQERSRICGLKVLTI